MSAIGFVARTRMGTVERGSVGGGDEDFLIDARDGQDISLNIHRSQLQGYDRAADDLLITLTDGRVIVLEGYFSEDGGASRLFLSSGGELNQVSLVEADGGALFAQYGPTETWGKWSPSDELIFVDDPQVALDGAMPYDGEGEEVSMLGAGLLAATGAGAAGVGAAGLGVAGLGAAALLGSGDGGDGGGGSGPATPTVDDPDSNTDIGGGDTPSISITGTGEPGSVVEVIVGDKTVITEIEDGGTWDAVFEGDDFPEDGSYVDIPVIVTDPDGKVYELDGPTFEIDTTPPALEITQGSVSLGDVFNAENHGDGVELSGSAEVGSSVTITIGDYTQTVIVGDGGSWSYNFDSNVLPAGEYTQDIVITATDGFGNVTTVTDQIQIDTVNEVALSNAPLTGDDMINAGEYAAGVTLTGTSQAGSSVQVTIQGQSQTVTAGGDGSWSVTFDSSNLTSGTYSTTAQIVSTDLVGNAVSMSHSFDVDTEASVTVNTVGVEGDGIVNSAERADGVLLTGTGEVGSAIAVTVAGTVLNTTVDGSGNWSVTIPAATVPTGTTSMAVSATSTDLAGNTATATGAITIDTETNVSVFTSSVEGDGVINAAEHADGVVLTGMAEPGATVQVTMGTVTHTAVATATGSWSANFAASDIPTGEQALNVTAIATDLAGNTATASGSVDVDTVVRNFATSTSPIEGDNVINAAEAADGFSLTGSTEPGSTVQVSFNGVTRSASVDANGNWSVDFNASEIPSGEVVSTALIRTVDPVGNTAETSTDIAVDTLVHRLNVSSAPNTADNVINAEEASQGFTMTGQVEVGSSVVVQFGGVSHTATVNGNGGWTVDIPPSSITAGTGQMTAVVEATDLAGNTRSVTETVNIDTDAPDNLAWEGYSRNHEGVIGIQTEISDETVAFGRVVDADGANPTVVDVALSNQVDIDALDLSYHNFSDAVPDGSHLILSQTDQAGNVSGSYLVTDDPATSEVTMTDGLASTLSEFNIETIDLEFAEDSHLTITEDQLTALSSNTDTLVVHGGVDDSVTITGAQATGTHTEGGETFNVFTLGDATLLIDDDITNVSTGVV